MGTRRSKEEWLDLVEDYQSSGMNLTAWCKNKGISRTSVYPYINKDKEKSEPLEQKWVSVPVTKNVDSSPIILESRGITIEIKTGFNKKVLSEVLGVLINIC